MKNTLAWLIDISTNLLGWLAGTALFFLLTFLISKLSNFLFPLLDAPILSWVPFKALLLDLPLYAFIAWLDFLAITFGLATAGFIGQPNGSIHFGVLLTIITISLVFIVAIISTFSQYGFNIDVIIYAFLLLATLGYINEIKVD